MRGDFHCAAPHAPPLKALPRVAVLRVGPLVFLRTLGCGRFPAGATSDGCARDYCVVALACRRRGPGRAALALQRMAGLSTARQHHAMFACCALQQALQHVAYLSAVRRSYMSDLGLLSTARGRVSLRDVAMVPLPPTCAAWSGTMLLRDYYATVDTMLPWDTTSSRVRVRARDGSHSAAHRA